MMRSLFESGLLAAEGATNYILRFAAGMALTILNPV
jgi:hypothetical protein